MASDSPQASAKLTDKEKVAKALELKARGNDAFRQGELGRAKGSYHRAILYIKGLSINSPSSVSSMASALGQPDPSPTLQPMDAETAALVPSLTADCNSNLAACLLKASPPKHERVVALCDAALAAQPLHAKALYRKGTALHALLKYDEAIESLSKAQSDPSIKKLIEKCKAAVKEEDKKLAQTYKKMFQS